MSDVRYGELQSLISELIVQMQSYDIWAACAPSANALQSDQPFYVDTLSFEQWLQFVMVPTFTQMIEQGIPLPNVCDISPMAQEVWKGRYSDVQNTICLIDQLLTGK
ncbi:YqcC family protein [Oceaniserpentilla sp. 4NH20-0058]|uniref:YqcC family protein n=1 Tax=Oceaniserpentilla sp. 4NH20-0058 TaxID=3127660 RepID=UPI00310A97D8